MAWTAFPVDHWPESRTGPGGGGPPSRGRCECTCAVRDFLKIGFCARLPIFTGSCLKGGRGFGKLDLSRFSNRGADVTIAECYAVLEIAPGASPDEVRKAYKLLATVWHPDRFPADSGLHKEAEEKLRRINEAYQTLKDHFAAGGGATGAGPAESGATSSGEAYVDWQCLYLGGDPRLRAFGVLERNRRAAIVRVASEGITIATVTNSAIDETVHYPAETILLFDTRGTTWAAPSVTLDPEKYHADLLIDQNCVKLQADDPEGIVKGFTARLQFRNSYFSELFQKRVRERFCPVNATKQCVEEQKRRAAERRAAEEKRRREKAKQTAERKHSNDTRIMLGAIGLFVVGIIGGLIAAVVQDSTDRSSDSQVSERTRNHSTSQVPAHPTTAVRTPTVIPVQPVTRERQFVPPGAWREGNIAFWVSMGDRPRRGNTIPGQTTPFWLTIHLELPEGTATYSSSDLRGTISVIQPAVRTVSTRHLPEDLQVLDDGEVFVAPAIVEVRNGVCEFHIRFPPKEVWTAQLRVDLQEVSTQERLETTVWINDPR